MGMVMSIVLSIFIFGLIIFIHELGHYSVAKLCNIKVDEFAIGMGPKLFGFVKGETAYSIRAVPFGGYVKMEGEDSSSDNERAFINKPAWQRLLVVLAGAFMNIVLGFILMLFLVISVNKLPDMTIKQFSEDAISNSCGLKEGDKILKIDGYKLKTMGDLNYILLEVSDRAVAVVVNRDDSIISVEDVKFPIIEDKDSGIKMAYIDFSIGEKDKTFIGIITYSYSSIISNVKSVWISLMGLISGKYSLNAMSGPVQITETMSVISTIGVRQLIKFVILITVNLGVINLLPLPALDGCRALFLLVEIVLRKKMKPEWEGYIHLVGLILLMLLSIVVTYNDILRLINKYIR